MMKKTTSIRLFCVLSAVCCCVAYGGGYYYSIRQAQEDTSRNNMAKNTEAEELQQEEEAAESAATAAAFEFILYEEEGYVIVYCADKETVYAITDISLQYLPVDLQKEIREGKPVRNEVELYNFLESYSS